MTAGSLKNLIVIAALAGIVAAVGLADHQLKSSRMHRADVAWWFCANERVGCGAHPEELEHRADRIERGWQQRESAYTLVIGALIGAAVMTALTARRKHPAVLGPTHA